MRTAGADLVLPRSAPVPGVRPVSRTAGQEGSDAVSGERAAGVGEVAAVKEA